MVERQGAQPLSTTKMVVFFGVLTGILALDISTKLLVQKHLHLYQKIHVVGDYVRLTYIYNPGAAFGIHLGDY